MNFCFSSCQLSQITKAVFGFCDIRNFTDCCEVLEEETMIFTNEIAFVVHGRVHSSGV